MSASKYFFNFSSKKTNLVDGLISNIYDKFSPSELNHIAQSMKLSILHKNGAEKKYDDFFKLYSKYKMLKEDVVLLKEKQNEFIPQLQSLQDNDMWLRDKRLRDRKKIHKRAEEKSTNLEQKLESIKNNLYKRWIDLDTMVHGSTPIGDSNWSVLIKETDADRGKRKISQEEMEGFIINYFKNRNYEIAEIADGNEELRDILVGEKKIKRDYFNLIFSYLEPLLSKTEIINETKKVVLKNGLLFAILGVSGQAKADFCFKELSDEIEGIYSGLGISTKTISVSSRMLKPIEALKYRLSTTTKTEPTFFDVAQISHLTNFTSMKINYKVDLGGKKEFPHLIAGLICDISLLTEKFKND